MKKLEEMLREKPIKNVKTAGKKMKIFFLLFTITSGRPI